MRNIAPDVYRLWPDLSPMSEALGVPALELARLRADDMLPDAVCDRAILRRAKIVGRAISQRDLRAHRQAAASLEARRDLIRQACLSMGGVAKAAERMGVSRGSIDVAVHRGHLPARHAHLWMEAAGDLGVTLPKWIFTALSEHNGEAA
jgi:hypothetical protein